MEYAAVDGTVIIIMMFALLIKPTQVMLEMVHNSFNDALIIYNGISSMNVADGCMIIKFRVYINRIVMYNRDHCK